MDVRVDRKYKWVTNAESHGLTKSPEYRTWASIKDRCYNVKMENYPRYGGKGIRMANEWLESFTAFYNYMGPKPGPEYSIDRIDASKNYEPGNCRWATYKEQALNSKHKVSKTGFRGVHFMGKRYAALLWKDHKIQRLGLFDTPEEAYEVYMQVKFSQNLMTKEDLDASN